MIIGFARRATAYKRATLLFRDEARIAPLLESGKLQLVYSGKAHPRDFGGQELVREMVGLAKKYPKSGRVRAELRSVSSGASSRAASTCGSTRRGGRSRRAAPRA